MPQLEIEAAAKNLTEPNCRAHRSRQITPVGSFANDSLAASAQCGEIRDLGQIFQIAPQIDRSVFLAPELGIGDQA